MVIFLVVNHDSGLWGMNRKTGFSGYGSPGSMIIGGLRRVATQGGITEEGAHLLCSEMPFCF
jgi:hypothetical protein